MKPEFITAAALLIDTNFLSEYTRGICEFIAEIEPLKDIDHLTRSKQIAKELHVNDRIIAALWGEDQMNSINI